MKLKKENLKPTLVLGIICLVVAALLASVNLLTKDVIKANEEAAIRASYSAALTAGTVFEDDITDQIENRPETLLQVIKEGTGAGYVAVISTKSQFSKGNLNVTLGVDPEGEIVGMKITSYFESRNIRNEDGTVDGYVGNDYDFLNGNKDVLVGGATYSSTAFRAAVTDALAAIENYKEAHK